MCELVGFARAHIQGKDLRRVRLGQGGIQVSERDGGPFGLNAKTGRARCREARRATAGPSRRRAARRRACPTWMPFCSGGAWLCENSEKSSITSNTTSDPSRLTAEPTDHPPPEPALPSTPLHGTAFGAAQIVTLGRGDTGAPIDSPSAVETRVSEQARAYRRHGCAASCARYGRSVSTTDRCSALQVHDRSRISRTDVAPEARTAARHHAAGQELAQLAFHEPRQDLAVAAQARLAPETFRDARAPPGASTETSGWRRVAQAWRLAPTLGGTAARSNRYLTASLPGEQRSPTAPKQPSNPAFRGDGAARRSGRTAPSLLAMSPGSSVSR